MKDDALEQKIYTCVRCGKRFRGRQDRCPRCGQLIVYEKDGRFFNALGDELVLSRDKRHIVKVIPNENHPR